MYGFRARAIFSDNLGLSEVNALLGSRWIDSLRREEWSEVTLSQDLLPSPTSNLMLTLQQRWYNRFGDGSRDSHVLRYALDWSNGWQKGRVGRVGVGAYTENVASPAADISSEAVGAGILLEVKMGDGVFVTLSANHEQRKFGLWAGGDFDRLDRSLTATIQSRFVSLSYFGFAPEVSLSHRKVDSSVPIFDRNEATIRFQVSSLF